MRSPEMIPRSVSTTGDRICRGNDCDLSWVAMSVVIDPAAARSSKKGSDVDGDGTTHPVRSLPGGLQAGNTCACQLESVSLYGNERCRLKRLALHVFSFRCGRRSRMTVSPSSYRSLSLMKRLARPNVSGSTTSCCCLAAWPPSPRRYWTESCRLESERRCTSCCSDRSRQEGRNRHLSPRNRRSDRSGMSVDHLPYRQRDTRRRSCQPNPMDRRGAVSAHEPN